MRPLIWFSCDKSHETCCLNFQRFQRCSGIYNTQFSITWSAASKLQPAKRNSEEVLVKWSIFPGNCFSNACFGFGLHGWMLNVKKKFWQAFLILLYASMTKLPCPFYNPKCVSFHLLIFFCHFYKLKDEIEPKTTSVGYSEDIWLASKVCQDENQSLLASKFLTNMAYCFNIFHISP